MKKCIFISVFILGHIGVVAQNIDEYKRTVMAEFKAASEKSQSDFLTWKTDSQKEFNEFRAKANAEFAQYMRETWEKTKGEAPILPVKEVPDIPPVIYPDFDDLEIPDCNEIPFTDDIPSAWNDEKPLTIPPIVHVSRPESQIISTQIYGTTFELHYDPKGIVRMKGSSENDVADMWEELSSSEYDNLLYDYLSIRTERNLCDWAYYRLTQSVAYTLYGDGNESVILTAFLMNQSGFRTRLSRNDNGTMHLLLAFDDDIFNTVYYDIGGTHYYLPDSHSPENLYIFKHEFPREKSLSLSIQGENLFDIETTAAIHLKSKRYPQMSAELFFNKNLLDFYNDYPHPYKRGNKFSNWTFYTDTELSMLAKEMLYPVIRKCIADKTQEEAANMLLNFVQTAFGYKSDKDQWGYERAFFPEETLFYPFSDCEDRSILFARLVRDLLGLDAVLIHYPGHLAAAVEFSENIAGDYIPLDGNRRFLICDPTYINAGIGMTMPGMDNASASVIRLSPAKRHK